MKVPYIDMHCDTVSEIWYSRLRKDPISLGKNDLMIDLDKLRRGGCLCQNLALYVNLHRPAGFDGTRETMAGAPPYRDPWTSVQDLVAVFQDLMKTYQEEIAQVTTAEEILENQKKGLISCLLTVEEGGVCKDSIKNLETLFAQGVRMMTLTWNFDNGLAHPNHPDKNAYYRFQPGPKDAGLSGQGFAFVERMQELPMIVDVSHLSDGGFWDVANTLNGPFVASHSNARALTHCSRNLTDEMIHTLAEHGGVMGLNFCPDFLDENNPPRETAAALAEQAAYVRKVGGIDVIGIGTDFDRWRRRASHWMRSRRSPGRTCTGSTGMSSAEKWKGARKTCCNMIGSSWDGAMEKDRA